MNIEEDIDINIDEDMGVGEEMMQDIEAQIHNIIKQSGGIPDNLYDHWMAFLHAVDWTEPLLISLLVFYVFLITTIIFFRDNVNVQTVIYVSLGIMVYFAETANTYLHDHWQEYTKQNYFDKNGIFSSTVYCFPLLCILIFQLVSVKVYVF